MIDALPTTVKVAAAVVCGVAGWFVGAALNRLLRGFFDVFNRAFAWTTRMYTGVVGGLIRVSAIVLLVYADCWG